MFVPTGVDCTPEQIGKAQEQWKRLIETRLSNMPHTSPVQNSIPNPEFIPLDNNNPSHASEDYHHDTSKRRRENPASTYGLPHHNHRRFRQPPWKPKGHRYTKGINGLHEEILHFFEYMSPRPEEAAMRRDVVQRIESVIHETWPSAKVEIFGSFRTGLYLPTSDIDMVIMGKWDDPPLNTMERKLIDGGICHPNDIKVLNNATVPIVKLVDSKTDVKVDISYNTVSGLKSAELIIGLMNKYPYMRHLVIVLKQFLLQRDLNEVFTGGVSSYSLILMVVSFLQLHPRQESLQEPNLGVLLIEFFELYGNQFNYLNIGLRIRDGGAYMRKEDLMYEMDSCYKQSLLCIEDPLYPSNDVGRSSYNVMHVKSAFKSAFQILNHRMLRQYCYLYEEDESILSRIACVTQDVQEYRKRVKETFPLQSSAATSTPSNDLRSSPSTYSYACAVKTGKDLKGTPSANGVNGKSDGDESDSSSASNTSSMSRSTPSLSATSSTTPPSSISSAGSEDDEEEQGQSASEASDSSSSISSGVQSTDEMAGVRSSSCTASPALAPSASSSVIPPPSAPVHSQPPTPTSRYRDAVLQRNAAAAATATQQQQQPHPRHKSHSSNARFRQQHHHHHHHNPQQIPPPPPATTTTTPPLPPHHQPPHHPHHQPPRNRKRFQKARNNKSAASNNSTYANGANGGYTNGNVPGR